MSSETDAAIREADEWLAEHRVTESWRVINRLRDTLVRQAERDRQVAEQAAAQALRDAAEVGTPGPAIICRTPKDRDDQWRAMLDARADSLAPRPAACTCGPLASDPEGDGPDAACPQHAPAAPECTGPHEYIVQADDWRECSRCGKRYQRWEPNRLAGVSGEAHTEWGYLSKTDRAAYPNREPFRTTGDDIGQLVDLGYVVMRREVTDWTPDLGVTVTDGGDRGVSLDRWMERTDR